MQDFGIDPKRTEEILEDQLKDTSKEKDEEAKRIERLEKSHEDMMSGRVLISEKSPVCTPKSQKTSKMAAPENKSARQKEAEGALMS